MLSGGRGYIFFEAFSGGRYFFGALRGPVYGLCLCWHVCEVFDMIFFVCVFVKKVRSVCARVV